MRYDAIVVGAGPAGSTTARECVARGLSVLLLEKADFPRDKPCGGAVTTRAAELLPFDIMPVVERVVFGIHLTSRRAHGFDRHSPNAISYLTQRRHLDSLLAERAVSEGAVLRERAAIREVERHPSHVVVRTADEVFEGSTLVAADGANGTTARLAGIDVGHVQGLALEGNITPQGGFPEKWRDMIGLDFGQTPGGYGWIFPKGNHLNIGIGGWKYVGPTLRGELDELVRFYGYDSDDLWGLRGYHLPIRGPQSPLVDGNIVLVGDAAGLLDPLTGEGIHAAIWSGRAAAQHLAEYVGGEVPDLDGYRRQVESELIPDLRVSRQFHDLLHLSPGLYLAIDRRTSIIWRLVCRILQGEQTYAGVMRMHTTVATAVDLLSDLIRVSPALRRIAGLREPAPPKRFFVRGTQHQ